MRESGRNFNNTVQQVSENKFVNINGGLSLDLGSAVETITLGDKLFSREVQSQSLLVASPKL